MTDPALIDTGRGARWLLTPFAAVLVLAVLATGCGFLVPSPIESYGPATWALDTRFPEPGGDTTDLHILVWERACNGGSQVVGRMAQPVVEFAEATVSITMRVRPLGGMQTCPGGPGTPVVIKLAEHLGERTLIDGGREPPGEPAPPF